MTVLTDVTAGNVCRVFAGGNDAIMAGVAGADHLGVINGHDWRKHIGGMAVFTDIGRLNVPPVLAGGLDAVMAADTVATDIQVIEIGG